MAKLAHHPHLMAAPPADRAPSRVPPWLGAGGIVSFLTAFLAAGLGLVPLAAGLVGMSAGLVLYTASLALARW